MIAKIIFHYDDKTKECTGQEFRINGQEVSPEDFADFTGEEVELVEPEEEVGCSDIECDEDCENCPYYDIESEIEDKIRDIIEDYTEVIKACNGCSQCINRELVDLIGEVFNVVNEYESRVE